MVNSQDYVKMNVFMQFLFDIEKLNNLVREKWIKIYDPDYIDNTIIRNLELLIPQMAELLAVLSYKATG